MRRGYGILPRRRPALGAVPRVQRTALSFPIDTVVLPVWPALVTVSVNVTDSITLWLSALSAAAGSLTVSASLTPVFASPTTNRILKLLRRFPDFSVTVPRSFRLAARLQRTSSVRTPFLAVPLLFKRTFLPVAVNVHPVGDWSVSRRSALEAV